jgi:ATP-binding cassette subfamily B protein
MATLDADHARMTPTTSLRRALRILWAGANRADVGRLATALLLVVMGAVLAGLAPVALKALIDAVTGNPRDAQAGPLAPVRWGAVYLLTLFAGRLLADLRPALTSNSEQGLYARLRQRFFRHLLELPLQFHLSRRSGDLAQCLPQAISGYQLVHFHLMNGVAPALVELATVTLVVATLAPPALSVTFMASALVHVAIMKRGRRALSDAASGTSIASIAVQGQLTDALLNVEAIKSFGAESSVSDRYARATAHLARCWLNLQRQRLRMGIAAAAVFALATSTSLAVAIHSVTRGALTIGGFVLATVYMLQIVRPLDMLGGAAREIAQALAFIRPLVAVLDEPSEMAPTAAPAVASSSGPRAGADGDPIASDARSTSILSLRGLHLTYGSGPPALCDVELDIAPCTRVALVGASGSGKTSLIRLLLRLHEPQRGSMFFSGAPVDRISVEELRSRIAVVPQDTILFNDTLSANIRLGKPCATQHQVELAARAAEIHDFITALPDGYDTVVGERGLKLSGGERQRVAIARAVLKDPLIYVFDEATSMLDSLTEASVLRSLQAISTGRTTITVAHRLSSIRHADQIVVLDGGRIVEQGTHTDLLRRRGHYAAMWRAQRQARSS